jgi:CRISPR-associated protein Csc1
VSRILSVRWELHEPMLFVARELGSVYQTEPVIGHYAQAYSLGLAPSRYGLTADETMGPRYEADLTPLAKSGIYLTPARPIGPVRTRFERFNAMGEGYRSRMDQGAVVDSLGILLTDGAVGRAINRPQQGVWQLVERGVCFEAFLVCKGAPPSLPAWTRIGKTSAKAAITVSEGKVHGRREGEFESVAWLCALDLPDDAVALGFDLLAIPPVPLLRSPRLRGRFLETSFGSIPADLGFRFS